MVFLCMLSDIQLVCVPFCPSPLIRQKPPPTSVALSNVPKCLSQRLSLSGAMVNSLPEAKCPHSPPRNSRHTSPQPQCLVGVKVSYFQLTKLAQSVRTTPPKILAVHILCTSLFSRGEVWHWLHSSTITVVSSLNCEKVSSAAQTQSYFFADLQTGLHWALLRSGQKP